MNKAWKVLQRVAVGLVVAALFLVAVVGLFPNSAIAQQLVRVNITLIGGTAPGATNPLPVRITDGSAYLTLASDATHDSAASSSGPQLMGECDDTSTDAVDEGDAGRLRVNCATRAVMVYRLDPCSSTAKTSVPIDISTATTTELTAALAGASNHYYICYLHLFTDAANDVALVDDDSDNCASVTAGVIGGVTAAEGWNFGATQGVTLGDGDSHIAKTNGTNRVLCLITSAATQLNGVIQVVAAP